MSRGRAGHKPCLLAAVILITHPNVELRRALQSILQG